MTTDTAATTATDDPTSIEVTFEDMYVLAAGDVDAFAINWNEEGDPPPFYVAVDGKRFAYTGLTFLVRGYGAALPQFVREEEQAGHLVLFVERDSRLLSYVYDPEAEADDEGGEAE
ncbi:MAG: hypothetical protein WD942_06275 [Dehalococcoidia bacterium]